MVGFDGVAQLAPLVLDWQQREKGRHVLTVAALGRRELLQDRPELVAHLRRAALEEAVDRIAGVRQHAPVGGVARHPQREAHVLRGRRLPAFEKASASDCCGRCR